MKGGAAGGAGDAAGGAATEKMGDRFYRALYAKLGRGEFGASSKPTLFLNLVFKVPLPRLAR